MLFRSSVRKEWILDKLKENKKYATADLVKYIEDNLDAYATIDIFEHMGKKAGTTSTAGLFSNPIKLRKGSLKASRPLFSATLETDIAIINAVNKSVAARKVCDFMGEYFPEEIEDASRGSREINEVDEDGNKIKIPEILPPTDSNQALIVYMDNGKMVGKYVPKYVADMFHSNPQQTSLAVQFFRLTSAPFKAIFTGRNPGFWPFNMMRDYQRAARTLPGNFNYITLSKYWTKAMLRKRIPQRPARN